MMADVQAATKHPGLAPAEGRLTRIQFATVVFLASELMFFGGLFAAYFSLRAQTIPWPPAGVKLEVVESIVMTGLLVASSLTMQVSLISLKRRDEATFRLWTFFTIMLGAVFLSLEAHGWVVANFRVSSHAYGTMFYTMTGFHGLHLFVGIMLLFVLIGRAHQGAYEAGDYGSAEAIGYYWHFVDVVWLALFLVLFVLQ